MTAGDKPGRRLSRGARIGRVAVRHTAREAIGSVRNPFLSESDQVRAQDERILRLADDLAATLGSMKGAAMKLGQVLSLLNFGLGSAESRAEFARRLEPLFSQAPAADNAAVLRAIDEELGARGRLLETVEPTPIASASLGQVYRGCLTDGRVVAIKAQYPSIRHAVRADLKNLALLIRLRPRHYAEVGLEDVVAEVSRQILAELDYGRELASHRAVYEAYRGHPVFVIPEPIDELCTERILVTEYLDGTQLHQLGDATQAVRDRIGEAIYRFYCGSLYTTGSFCADPHPGNVIVLPDNRVGFLDFGLYVRMTAAEIELERAIFAAVMSGDAQTAHRLACAAGFIVDSDAMPAEMALRYMQTVGEWFFTPGVVQVTDRTAYKSLTQAMMPRSEFRSGVFRQRLQSAHAFSRRTEMSVCALLGTLEATAAWRDIASEWILQRPPATEMGRQIAAWHATR